MHTLNNLSASVEMRKQALCLFKAPIAVAAWSAIQALCEHGEQHFGVADANMDQCTTETWRQSDAAYSSC